MFSDAGHHGRGYLLEVVGAMSVVRNDDLKPPSERATRGRADAHLRHQACDHDTAHASAVKNIGQVGPGEAVIARLADDPLVGVGLQLQVPAWLPRLVKGSRRTVILQVDHDGTGPTSSQK